MTKIYLKHNEQTDTKQIGRILKKFKKMCDRDGILKEFRKHEFYEKPSDSRRRDKERNRINFLRKIREKEESSSYFSSGE